MRYERTWDDARKHRRTHPYTLRLPEPQRYRRFNWRLMTIPVAGFTTGWGLMAILGGLL